MSIYIGTTEITSGKIYVGTTPAKAVYVGTTKVRPTLPIPSNGLLGYRPLQSDLKDASGNGKDGSWYSGTGTFSTYGGKTGAYVTRRTSSPNISTQHIVTPVSRSSLPISVCGWINYTQMTDTDGMWRGMFSNSDSSGNTFTLGLRSADSKKPYIVVNGNGTKLSDSAPTQGTWYCICITYNGTSLKYYVNGSLSNTLSISASSLGSPAFRFGCSSYDNYPNAWGGTTGYVRHFAIYNRILADAEVLQFYNNTK